MTHARAFFALALLLAAGCGKADSLVVVSVSSATQLDGVARLHVLASISGAASSQFDVRPGAPFSIPPAKTFGIQVPSQYGGTMTLNIDAYDGSDTLLASGTQSVSIAAGRSTDAGVVLGGGGPSDMGTDGGSGPILTILPTSYAFAQVAKGQPGATQQFTITNADVATTPALPAASLGGAVPAGFKVTSDGCQGTTLDVGSSCTVTVQFSPMAAGKNTAQLALGSAAAQLQGYATGTWKVDASVPLDMTAPPSFTAVWSAGAGSAVWVTSSNGTASGSVWRRDTTGAWTQPINAEAGSLFSSVWGISDSDFWVGGKSTLSNNGPLAYHHDATKFTPQGAGIAVGTVGSFLGLSGRATDDVWGGVDVGGTGGSSSAFHWTGKVWVTEQPMAHNLVSVWADPGTKEVFGVGFTSVAPSVYHYFVHRTAAGTWEILADAMIVNGPLLNGVWGSSATDVYIVGNSGTLFHWNGSVLAAPTVAPPAVSLYGVWGSGADDLYAVGDNGTILHSAGGNVWDVQSSGVTVPLRAVGGSGANVYAVGDGVILHYD